MNIALVLASGIGSRLVGISVPKQFLVVNNKPLMVYSLEVLNSNDNIDAIVITTNEDRVDEVKEICERFSLNKVSLIIPGGKSRQESVYKGLLAIKQLAKTPDDVVLIHDSARPLINQRIVNDNIKAVYLYSAVETAIKVSDTIAVVDEEKELKQTLNRDELYQVQTPQTFKLSLILEAHEKALKDGVQNASDDAQLITRLNMGVQIVEGEKSNFKVTTMDDLKLFETMLKKEA